MSTAALAAPLLTGTMWEDLVAELGVGVLLLHEHGGVRAAGGTAAGLAEVPADLAVLAAQVLRTGCTATVPLVICGGARWVEVYPVRLRRERLALVLLRPVDTDVWRGKGLLDPLTGLPNRVLLIDRLGHALARARTQRRRVTLVLVRVSGIGAAGPGDGDRLLAQVAGRLRAGLPEDTTVARYAGATFAVVVDHQKDTGGPVAGRVATLAAAPVRTGWATSDGGDPVPDLIGRAQQRLTT
jgi:GGDEF domain-containing protein